MKQKRALFFAICTFSTLLVTTSCKKSSNNTTSSSSDTVRTQVSQYVEVDGRSIYYVTNLPGDTSSNAARSATPVLFSFSTNGKIDTAQKLTTQWDVAFSSLYNSYVTCNNTSVTTSPGYSGQGQGAIYLVNKSFDSVTTVPQGSPDANGSIGMVGYPSASWEGWYNYNQSTHILTPITGLTLVIKTATGKYAKLAMTSLYKDNPANPTLSTPLPYLTFKYYLQQNGSTDLTTK